DEIDGDPGVALKKAPPRRGLVGADAVNLRNGHLAAAVVNVRAARAAISRRLIAEIRRLPLRGVPDRAFGALRLPRRMGSLLAEGRSGDAHRRDVVRRYRQPCDLVGACAQSRDKKIWQLSDVDLVTTEPERSRNIVRLGKQGPIKSNRKSDGVFVA